MRLLILAAVVAVAYGHSACPPLWTHMAGSCWRFFPDRLRWEDAKTTCGQFAPCSGEALGQLAKIDSAQTNDFLKIYLNDFVAQPPVIDFWTGGNDIALERDQRWSDGTQLTYLNWGQSQPDNGATSTGQPENCVMFSGETGQWFDASCAMMMPYICMFPAERERMPMFPRFQPPLQPGPGNPGIGGPGTNNPNQPGVGRPNNPGQRPI